MDQRVSKLLTDLRARVATLRIAVRDLGRAINAVSTKHQELAEAGAAMQRPGRRRRRIEALRLLATLSPRQRDVLERIMAGQSNKVMAFELGVGEKTIETHRARLMRKLRATTLAQMVEKALLAGWQPALDTTRGDESRPSESAGGDRLQSESRPRATARRTRRAIEARRTG